MRHTTATLAELIPDIVVRTRAEIEAEEAEVEDDIRSDDEKPVRSSRKAGSFSSKGVSQKAGPKGGASMMRGPLREELENKLLNGVREGSIPISQDGRSSSQVNGMFSSPPPGGTPIGDLEAQLDPAQVAQQAREEGGDESDDGDILGKQWYSSTQQARAKYASRRHKLFRKPLGEDEPGLIRTKKGMSKFREWNAKTFDVVRFKEPDPDPDPDPEADDVSVANDEENQEEDQFLVEYDVTCGTLNGPAFALDEETIRELYSTSPDNAEYSSIGIDLTPVSQ
jgi:transcriptional activator SPT7